jgi:photosystem II stability/assembly factor-like uncharacterized protein
MQRHITIQNILLIIITSCCFFTQIYGQDDMRGAEGPCNNSKVQWGSGWKGYVICEDGRYFETPDSGFTWIEKSKEPSERFNSLSTQKSYDASSKCGTIVGDNGVIRSTSDRGENWTPVSSGTTNNLRNVYYGYCPSTNESWAYAIGDNSTIIYSSDGGFTWFPQTTPYHFDHLYGIFFYNNVTGWIVGTTGIIYATTNSGSNWEYKEGDPSNPDYYGVYFVDPLFGWICGTNGYIGVSTNGGNSFTKQITNTTKTIRALYFKNSNNGYAVGDDGTFLQTTDKGATWTQYNLNTTEDLKDITVDEVGNLWIAGNGGTLFTNKPQKQSTNITVSSTVFNFGSVVGNDQILGGVLDINTLSELPAPTWNVKQEGLPSWLSVNPLSEQGAGSVTILIETYDMPQGEYHGTITLEGENQTIPIVVNLSRKNPENDQAPFGELETPLNGATVSGSVPVTGWALDDVDMQSVEIWYQNNSELNYLGDAAFIEGARPDIAEQYPNYPYNTKAGWGYMLLTNFLPDGSNSISAYGIDYSGNKVNLGTSTIYVNNAHAVKPFGAIDSPAQGETVQGSTYRSSGWVLTPQPNQIPSNGSTINVFIDGVQVGHPTYNLYRQDIASLFPGYLNNNGAIGYFDFNVTQYSDGLHTIAWTATDNAGNTDGIGSMYFAIQNTRDDPVQLKTNELHYGSPAGGLHKANLSNSTFTQSFQIIDYNETTNWKVSSNQSWIILSPLNGSGNKTVNVEVNPTSLAAGTHTGWVMLRDTDEKMLPKYIDVCLDVYSTTEAPFGEFNYPDKDREVSGTVKLLGWALDDVGVASVKIYRKSGSQNITIGDAEFTEDTMPIIESMYSNYPFSNRAGWSYSLASTTLTDGDYTFVAEVTDFEGKTTMIESEQFRIVNNPIDVEEVTKLPKETILLLASPNPFNPSTTITFELHKNSNISLIIYDLLGREVTTLIDDENRAAGSYKLNWNGKNSFGIQQASGIYFLVMKSGDYMKTQKLMMLK